MQRMPPYGPEHLSVLAVVAVVAVLWTWWTRRNRGTAAERRVTTAAGWVGLAAAVLWTGWDLLPQNFTVEQSLPFHFSDAMRFAVPIAMITRQSWAVAISVYWGLTLNLQSMLTPDLNYRQYPELEFVMYWFLHAMVMWGPIILVWGLGLRPTWRGYAVAFGAVVGWALLALGVNALTGANYGYLSHAPAGPSLLDYLGGWPWYLAVEVVLVASVWALMTWGFTASARAAGAPLADRAGLLRQLPG